ncbi:8862_t:CDS:2 [Ambispora leptoticha]|uniref:8862_t:CDS:1 n=1 Tax=Ambispora leptoticha TaxID=144679 RepID=A0A9N8ZBG5_9GLOM|nr:8862_t:CDS:2 [Ambispora leptoticha]
MFQNTSILNLSRPRFSFLYRNIIRIHLQKYHGHKCPSPETDDNINLSFMIYYQRRIQLINHCNNRLLTRIKLSRHFSNHAINNNTIINDSAKENLHESLKINNKNITEHSNKSVSTNNTTTTNARQYPKIVIKILTPIAKWFGYATTGVAYRLIGDFLPDTFQTWFTITQLHVWMLMVRLRPEKDGKVFSQYLVDEFFDDAEKRIRQDYNIKSSRFVTRYMKIFREQFKGGILAYDEAIFNSDPVLAAALWRNIFNASGSAQNTAFLVEYVRNSLQMLDNLNWTDLDSKNVKFLRPDKINSQIHS